MMTKGAPPDPRRTMRRLFIYSICALILLATAGPLLVLALREATRLLGSLFGDHLFAGILIATALLSVLGVIIWMFEPKRTRRSRPIYVPLPNRDLVDAPPAPGPEHHPKDFTERLAGYLHCEEEELAGPRPYPASSMSFWSRVGQLRWMGPKPAFIIRRLLERIREQVHGRAH
jgi:hypothetical protein